jgi:hypothetical protein
VKLPDKSTRRENKGSETGMIGFLPAADNVLPDLDLVSICSSLLSL